jgi:hypothetical protein
MKVNHARDAQTPGDNRNRVVSVANRQLAPALEPVRVPVFIDGLRGLSVEEDHGTLHGRDLYGLKEAIQNKDRHAQHVRHGELLGSPTCGRMAATQGA